MAEYYPLLAKAVGSLPNSTPESRRVVYERARKALIGQLRTLHPPVPEEDVDRESVALDKAVERLEAELAGALAAGTEPEPPLLPPAPTPAALGPAAATSLPDAPDVAPAPKAAALPLRTRLPTPRRPVPGSKGQEPAPEATREDLPGSILPDDRSSVEETVPVGGRGAADGDLTRPRGDGQRPIAPQPPRPAAPKRRVWIMSAAIGIVVLLVAGAAFKLRQSRETVSHKPTVEAAVPTESGKIAERVGGTADTPSTAQPTPSPQSAPDPTTQAATAPANPEVPVQYRAALLVEAPTEANKVKTFLGTVTWKLVNVGTGPSDTVGTAVEADVDLPDDKAKVSIIFEKNTDASLPASHTLKVRFTLQPDSPTGDVQQISVPEVRQEDSPRGDALAGVTVPVVQNSFLIGLSPGAAEAVNLRQLKDQQWIDIPILLTSGKIAKLTFEKGQAGQRDIAEAIAAWSKL